MIQTTFDRYSETFFDELHAGLDYEQVAQAKNWLRSFNRILPSRHRQAPQPELRRPIRSGSGRTCRPTRSSLTPRRR